MHPYILNKGFFLCQIVVNDNLAILKSIIVYHLGYCYLYCGSYLTKFTVNNSNRPAKRLYICRNKYFEIFSLRQNLLPPSFLWNSHCSSSGQSFQLPPYGVAIILCIFSGDRVLHRCNGSVEQASPASSFGKLPITSLTVTYSSFL